MKSENTDFFSFAFFSIYKIKKKKIIKIIVKMQTNRNEILKVYCKEINSSYKQSKRR